MSQTVLVADDTPAPAAKTAGPGRLLELARIDRLTQLASEGLNRAQAGLAQLMAASAPLRARISPVLAIVQPGGWACLGVAVGCLVVGARFGWAELLVAAVFLLAVFVIATGFIIGRSTYAVEIDFSRLRVKVGDIAEAGLTISNTGARSLLPCLFIVPVGKGAEAFAVPRLAPQEPYYESFRVPTSRRMVIPIGPVRSSRGDALGLLKREADWTGTQELFVHPLTIALDDSSAGFLKDLEGRPTDTLSSSDIAFHALREYVVGDDLRHVHWRTSARIGKLMVRQFEETRRSHLVVCLSMSPADYASDDDFELAVSSAASLAQQAIRQEIAVTLQVPGRQMHTVTAQRLLDDCSRLEFGAPCDPVTTVAQVAAQQALDVSVAVIVTGGQAAPAELHAALARFSVEVYTGAICCATGQTPQRQAIGGNPVLTIGQLDDLPQAVRGLGA